MGWMNANKLKRNPDKIKVLWVSRKAEQELQTSPVLDGVILSLKKPGLQLGSTTRHSGHVRKSGGCDSSECLCPASASASATPVPSSVRSRHSDLCLGYI